MLLQPLTSGSTKWSTRKHWKRNNTSSRSKHWSTTEEYQASEHNFRGCWRKKKLARGLLRRAASRQLPRRAVSTPTIVREVEMARVQIINIQNQLKTTTRTEPLAQRLALTSTFGDKCPKMEPKGRSKRAERSAAAAPSTWSQVSASPRLSCLTMVWWKKTKRMLRASRKLIKTIGCYHRRTTTKTAWPRPPTSPRVQLTSLSLRNS